MSRTHPSSQFLRNHLFHFAALPLLILASAAVTLTAQTAQSLSTVKKVYLDSFGQDDTAIKLRERIVQQLRKYGKLQVVSSPPEADAVLKGNADIWVTGYVSTNPRVPSNGRQPVIQGFLSAELIGKDNEPLWSYLVTPSKFRAAPITHDLADQLVAKLIAALDQKNDQPPPSPLPNSPVAANLNAAGATFPAPLYQRWFESFQQRFPNAHINYSPVGSEAGLALFARGKLDFAASDILPPDPHGPESQSSLLYFPTVLGAVVPIYNLKAVDRTLNFTPEALAGIYLGKIKSWNDLKIRSPNKGAPLPDTAIVVVHRSDGSGTTFVWTDFLSKVSAEWKSAVGTGADVKWPGGVGVEGNEAVAAMVRQTPNSIGYVELVYALRHQLNFAAVQNSAGEFIQADLASVSAAATSAPGAMTSGFRVSITNPPGKRAYPISAFTWWLFPPELGGAAKKPASLELLQWMLASGQKQCSALGYAPLPREIATRELQSLSTLK
jgi:phosphate ABC transporter phosphate-binding protein